MPLVSRPSLIPPIYPPLTTSAIIAFATICYCFYLIFFDTDSEFVSKIRVGGWLASYPFHDITGVSGGLYGHFRALPKALRTKTR